jgi:hypothetical protein
MHPCRNRSRFHNLCSGFGMGKTPNEASDPKCSTRYGEIGDKSRALNRLRGLPNKPTQEILSPQAAAATAKWHRVDCVVNEFQATYSIKAASS